MQKTPTWKIVNYIDIFWSNHTVTKTPLESPSLCNSGKALNNYIALREK